MTRLCVPIYVRSVDQARRDAFVAVERGAEMVELRLDALADDTLLDAESADFAAIVELANRLIESNVKIILTMRPRNEGGKSDLDDETRFDVLAGLAVRAPAWVDLEWRPMSRAGGWPMNFLELAAVTPVRTITSAHDFETRPNDLMQVFAEISQSRADAAKVAWRARSVRDNIEAFELLREAAKPSVVICMGEAGLPSRVLSKKFNAFLTFASLADEDQTADGQVPVDVLKGRFRWDAIKRSTKVYGVVGHPVAHSRSPHVHNAQFDAIDHDGVYLPLLVEPGYESFKAFMETWLRFEPLDLAGLSITLPHKENALRYAKEIGGSVDATAERVGSVNTFTVHRNDGEATVSAANTDLDAMVQTVRDGLGREVAGLSVGVLGAGGTGRTATAAFTALGCDVTIYNRTAARAEALADEFAATAARLADVGKGVHDVWINTTSLGMAPDTAESPLGDIRPVMTDRTLVFDTIYTPAETTFLRNAREAGARTVNGIPMFLHQAAAQSKLWTGNDVDLDVLRRAFDGSSGPATAD
ncbi:MAG: type I 3-dehydroquinate dehydratase [Planctomycetota bacterium]